MNPIRRSQIFTENPKLYKSKSINMHRNFYNKLKGKLLSSDLKAEFRSLQRFDYTLDTITTDLSNLYMYRNSLKIFSKNKSALHIDGDNCINCLVNIDENNTTYATIVLNEDFEKLNHNRIHHGDINEIFSTNNIQNYIKINVNPGEILIFDSNNYHSFDCGMNGVKLLVHKYINYNKKNKLYDPIYTEFTDLNI